MGLASIFKLIILLITIIIIFFSLSKGFTDLNIGNYPNTLFQILTAGYDIFINPSVQNIPQPYIDMNSIPKPVDLNT